MVGPRDWSPSEVASPLTYRPCPPASNGPGYRGSSFGASNSRASPSYRRPASIRSAWLSLVLGFVALAFAFIQPENSSTTRGFLASTIGIAAISYGVHAMRHRRPGVSMTFVLSVLGITFGIIGSLVMAIYLAAYFFVPASVDVAPPGVLINPPASIAQDVTPEIPKPPAPVVPAATADEEAMSLAQAMGTMDFALRNFSADDLYPESLIVTTADGRITAPSGVVLVALPPGTLFAYTVSADRTQYSSVMTGGAFGTTASFDSKVGQVLLGGPR